MKANYINSQLKNCDLSILKEKLAIFFFLEIAQHASLIQHLLGEI